MAITLMMRNCLHSFVEATSNSDALRQDIAVLLGENIFRRGLTRRIGACRAGRCRAWGLMSCACCSLE